MTKQVTLLSLVVVTILLTSMLAVLVTIVQPANAQQAPQLPVLSPAAQQLPREQRNWELVNANPRGTNYNPQNQINKDNVQFLELKWIYPMPTAAQQGHRLADFVVAEGTMAPPLVVDGVIYSALNSRVIVALDAKTGKEIWRYIPQANRTALEARLPILGQSGHTHAMNYIDGNLWIYDFGCRVTLVDAKTGKLARAYEDLCLDFPFNRDDPRGWGIPTNSGYFGGLGSHPPPVYRAGNLFIYAMGGPAEGTQGGRSHVAGVDLYTGAIKWRFFYQPPCGDPLTCKPVFEREKQEWGNWLVQNCNKIWIQGIKSCELDQELLRNDRGNMRFNSGVSNVWGNMVVDEETGTVYFGTAQSGPDWNATYDPGFRLFGASVIALNARNGELVWAHQTTAHDLWDYDCSWNTVLANAKVKGQDRKVVIKGCKNGIVHVFDAATGEKLYFLESPDIKRTPLAQLYDPRNKEQMTKKWTNYPDTGPFWMNCPAFGCLESDIAYEPSRNMVFATTHNAPAWAQVGNADLRGVSLASRTPTIPAPFVAKSNTTINAWNVNDGSLKWRYFIDGVAFRGGTISSGGLVWTSANDAFQRAFDADTGKVLYEANIGLSTGIQPTIGADVDGKMKLLRVVGGQQFILGGVGSLVPGAIMAYGLPDKVPAPKEVVKEVVKEVPKEVIKEVPKEVVKEITVETISPVSYGIIGLGIVIAVVGIVMSRRKKA